MIENRKKLKEILEYEKKLYFCHPPYNRFYLVDKVVHESYQSIWRFQKLLRKSEYYFNNRNKILHLLMYIIICRKKNKLGIKLGLTIPVNVFDQGLIIDHYGNIVINGCARVGRNCRLHGNNCIGNKGLGRESEFPILGDNIDIGFGASIIGAITLTNNITIASGAIVCKSFEEDNIILAGIPAKIISKK